MQVSFFGLPSLGRVAEPLRVPDNNRVVPIDKQLKKNRFFLAGVRLSGVFPGVFGVLTLM